MRQLIALLSLLIFQGGEACTAFQIKSEDGAHLYCRSMEFGLEMKSNLLVVPQGTDYQGTAPDAQGMEWKTQYGYVGMNQWMAPTYITDGMNEKGLIVGVLYLPRFAEYQKPDPKLNDKTLGAWELASFLLGTCSSLDEVKTALNQVVVAEQKVPQVNFSFPLHFYIGDNNGNVLIVEYVGGQRKEYDNPIGVLTNSPPFDWHMNNLSNFVNLSPINVPKIDIKGDAIQLAGQGSGLLGIPGDYTPPSRFVRAALFSTWALPPKTAFEGANLGFHILNTFDIFWGIIRDTNEKGSADYTQWTVVHDRTNLKTYFRTYNSLQIQMVDLKKLDFKQPGFQQVEPAQQFIVDDVTSKIKKIAI